MNFKRKAKKFFVGLAAAATVFAVGASGLTAMSQAHADTNTSSSLHVKAKAAIAVDAQTGQIIYGKNENQALPVASMSKLLAIYIVLKNIHEGKLSWNQKVAVDSASQKVSQNRELSNVPLKKGHKYTVRSLYQASLIYSANGAVMALANAVAGSQQKFVDMMRSQAKQLGIKDATIYTCNGLPNDEVSTGRYPGAPAKGENKLSARDMGLLSYYLLKKYPEILNTTKIKKMKFNNGTSNTEMENWNWMLPGLAKSYTELPVDGLKTGTSDKAGACFTGTVNKDGHRIITVVMGARHNGQNDLSRFVQTQKIMSYVYDDFIYTPISSGASIAGAKSMNVKDGKQAKVSVGTGSSTNVWLKKGLTTANLQGSLTKKTAEAPVKKGDQLGKIELTSKNQPLKTVTGKNVTVKAAAASSVAKANIFVRIWRAIFH